MINLKTRIALVTELYSPNIGGQEIRFKELGESFIRLGFQVSIFTIAHEVNLHKYENVNGIEVYRIIKDQNYKVKGKKGRKISTIFKFTFALRSYLYNNFDLVIFNQWPLLPSIFSFFLVGNRNTITCLDFVEYRSGFLHAFINFLLFRTTTNIACISDSIMKRVTQSSVDNSKCFVSPSTVNTNFFFSSTKEFYVFIGRLEFHKHPEHAILCVLNFNRKHPQLKRQLHIIGGGNLLENLQEKYSHENDIVFHGFVSDDEKIQILSKSRILIFPSEREGLPKSIIECMCCGVPTITTNYVDNGSKDFVRQYNIGLVSNPDLDSLTSTILDLENNYDVYVNSCLSQRSNFDIDINAIKYLKQLNMIQK